MPFPCVHPFSYHLQLRAVLVDEQLLLLERVAAVEDKADDQADKDQDDRSRDAAKKAGRDRHR